MENCNYERWLGLMSAAIVSSCMILLSCTSDYEPETLECRSNVVHCSSGETIVLSDTSVYVPEFDDAMMASTPTCVIEDWNTLMTRSSTNSSREYGYDSEVPESDWKKYSLGSTWQQKYGITPGIYIARYVKVHKNLPILPSMDINVADYTLPNAPQNVMGWLGTSGTIGFTAEPSTDYVADGITRVFYINCNLAGVSYNQYIPANPSNFEWAYVLSPKVDVW